MLRALAAARDVHLFLLHPSPELWDRIAADDHGHVTRRRADPTAALAGNRLLASWGQDVRELQLVLERAGEHVAHHHPAPAGPPTLLAAIQAGIRDDAAPPGRPLHGLPDDRPLLDPGDRSVRIHACHGRARQVEVLRDAVLHALADDPTLEPRDVIVMCPDIEAFAPLIHAAFGTGEQEPFLEVRLADRALRQTNPLLGVVARLLELAGERLTASQVLDLADRPPVRRRFRFDDDELARAEEWVRESGVRWGLDAADRAPYKLATLGAGTWRAGLDRLLAGVALADDELWAGVLPLGVESGAIDLAGRLAELLDRLGGVLAALRRPQPIAAWAAALAEAADALTAAPERDAWQRGELERLLGDLVAEAEGAEPVDLVLEEVRALLAERLRGRPTRANFRTGHLTICTLVPMRSVPHRVVCLLGLDDAAFPRKAPRDGDDLLLDDPHVGEPDARLEDRQLLLDALMAASDRLIVTYTGNDERTNAIRPPAVPIGELLDVIDRTVRVADDRPPREHVVRRHKLQPFDPENFAAAAPWSFDGVTLEGARALTGPRTEPAAVPARAVAARRRARGRARRPRPLRGAPRAPVPARPPRRPADRRRGGGRRRAAGRARPPRPVARRPAAAGGAAARARARRRGGRRARAGDAPARRARRADPRAAAPDRRDDRPPRARAPARGGADGRRARRASRRPRAQRRRAGRDRRPAARRGLRAGEPAQPAGGVGAAARASPSRTRRPSGRRSPWGARSSVRPRAPG